MKDKNLYLCNKTWFIQKYTNFLRYLLWWKSARRDANTARWL